MGIKVDDITCCWRLSIVVRLKILSSSTCRDELRNRTNGRNALVTRQRTLDFVDLGYFSVCDGNQKRMRFASQADTHL